MMKTGNVRSKWLGGLVCAAAALVVVTLPGRAFAQFSNGTITVVEYSYNGGNPQLSLQQPDPNNANASLYFVAPKTAPMGCGLTNIDIDTMKTWQSIAQAAKLSGMATTIYYSACSGKNYITDVVMFK